MIKKPNGMANVGYIYSSYAVGDQIRGKNNNTFFLGNG
jgi:hypothetical protein